MSLCLLAIVHGVHGIKGWLKVAVFSDIENRLSQQNAVLVGRSENRTKLFKIEDSRDNGRQSFVKLVSVDDRNDAEALIGTNFYITDEQMLPPPEGMHYVHDLIGCEVFDVHTDRYLGRVRDVLLLPANDVYVVENEDSETLVPAVPDFIYKVDIEAKRITVKPLPGLFEDENDEN